MLDGGIADRPGWAGLSGERRVLLHHLPSRSRPRTDVPSRVGARIVCTEGLPRVGPFRLAAGMAAFDMAWRCTARALERPAHDVIRVSHVG